MEMKIFPYLWVMANTTQPDKKKAAVGAMFDSIAWRYDFLNHFLSFGIDRIWRRKAIRIISGTSSHSRILDVATGTGDLAITAMKLNPEKITGIDISTGMLEIGREKIKNKGLTEKIELFQGDSENILFPDNSFDVAMVAFGVRNFSDPVKGLTEMNRVLEPNGMIMVLEFSKPSAFPFRQIFNFYFLNILPLFGRYFSKNREAYQYLPDTVMKFPENEEFMKLMSLSNFVRVSQKKLSFGVASIYTGFKSDVQ
jgi:demethylmenaquinone methyltransferase/2-methoxy-6-polyprenyl-1,4-benzoquinol methylase